jgi:cyclic-di-GMP phosphodiesterase TipF (flagellum assembly factor)
MPPSVTNGASANGLNPVAGPDAGDSDVEMIAKVRKSLEENRVDLYLQPVVSLPQRRTRYYEALTRLRDSGGDIIMPASYLQAAETAGIMPMIDNLLLFRCVKVMRRLVERNREIGVFCNISAPSLLDAEFFPQFLEFMKQNEELSDALIFEFSQSTVNGAGPLELESLAMLRDLGFSFSMDHVSSLDIDYQSLADRGFRFLKVDARTMIDGMGNAGAQIHSADLKALLSRFGLQLIAEKVETERDVVTLLDFDVGLAQGYLFSEPRLVREEIIDTPAARPSPSPVA